MIKKNNFYHKKNLIIYILFSVILSSCNNKIVAEQPAFKIYPQKNINAENDKEIINIINQSKDKKEKANILTGVNTPKKVLSITFDGVRDLKTMNDILRILEKNKIKSVFFLEGSASLEQPDLVKIIQVKGHQIENYSLKNNFDLSKVSDELLAKEIYGTNKDLKSITELPPSKLKLDDKNINDRILEISKASGIKDVIKSNYLFNEKSFPSAAVADEFLNNIIRGSVVTFKLSGTINELNTKKDDSKPKVITTKKNSKKTVPEAEKELQLADTNLVQNLETFIDAAKNHSFEFVPLDELQNYKEDDFISNLSDSDINVSTVLNYGVTTSYPGLSILISNISDKASLDLVLTYLEDSKIKVNFVVTGDDIINNKDSVKLIVSKGHSIVNSGLTKGPLTKFDYNQSLYDIFKGADLIEKTFNIKSTIFIPPNGKTSDAIIKACAELGFSIVRYNRTPSKSGNTVESFKKAYLNGFHRGDVIFFELGENENLLGILDASIKQIETENYEILPLAELIKHRFTFRNLTDIKGWDAIKVNTKFDKNADSSSKVIEQIPTEEKIVFLSFDDWGSDETITKILDILKKEDVKASFFLRANGVETNPNLARAISEEGHDIGNHTFSHEVVSQFTGNELQNDIVKAHKIITQSIDREPELLFRPPTLALTNEKANEILSSGFKYIVRGKISTQDYKRTAQEVISYTMERVEPGSIVIMHISDNSSASKALPELIKKLRSKGYSFKKLSEYLK